MNWTTTTTLVSWIRRYWWLRETRTLSDWFTRQVLLTHPLMMSLGRSQNTPCTKLWEMEGALASSKSCDGSSLYWNQSGDSCHQTGPPQLSGWWDPLSWWQGPSCTGSPQTGWGHIPYSSQNSNQRGWNFRDSGHRLITVLLELEEMEMSHLLKPWLV